MLIDEKGLCRALRAAWKGSGYVIIHSDTDLTIYTEDFLVSTSWEKLPRKALGLLAEQIGYLPTEPGALAIARDEAPQTVLEDVVGDSVEEWTACEGAQYARRVPLKMWGADMFQTETRQLYGILRGLDIVDRKVRELGDAEIRDGTRMVWKLMEDDELVVLRAIRPVPDREANEAMRAAWEALERVDLRPAGE